MAWLRRLAVEHVGRRGGFLLFLALLDGLYGYSLLADPLPALRPYSLFWPPAGWASLWITVGAVCAVQAFMRADRLAFILAAVLKTAWAVVWIHLWTAGFPRAWISVALWAVFAAVVVMISGWPECREPRP